MTCWPVNGYGWCGAHPGHRGYIVGGIYKCRRGDDERTAPSVLVTNPTPKGYEPPSWFPGRQRLELVHPSDSSDELAVDALASNPVRRVG